MLRFSISQQIGQFEICPSDNGIKDFMDYQIRILKKHKNGQFNLVKRQSSPRNCGNGGKVVPFKAGGRL